MNCPSRTDEQLENEGWNQNPPRLAADLTTREDLNGTVNRRTQREADSAADRPEIELPEVDIPPDHCLEKPHAGSGLLPPSVTSGRESTEPSGSTSKNARCSKFPDPALPLSPISLQSGVVNSCRRLGAILVKFGKFIGPGFMISVAYIDPGNYSTDVAAGASTRFKLLFIVLLSNVFAILLQSLAVRLGTVTGLNLAENCRAHLPRWLNVVLYVMGEAAIIATDIAEVRSEHYKIHKCPRANID